MSFYCQIIDSKTTSFFEKNRICTLYINIKTKIQVMKTYSLENNVNIAQNTLQRNMQYDEYDHKIPNLIDKNIEEMYCVIVNKTIAQTIS